MPTPDPDSLARAVVRPGDFARILLTASGAGPRARARDQQADLAGETTRQRVLNLLILADPEPEELDAALQAIIVKLGEPAGPSRGACTAIRQEWEMTRLSPDYWSFLVKEAVRSARDTDDHRPRRSDAAPGRD
jgi:hypothetical protein